MVSIVYCYQDNLSCIILCPTCSSVPDKENGKLDAHAVSTHLSVNKISVHVCSPANVSANQVRWVK